MSLVQNQEPVETLRASGPHESLRDRVRLGCSNRRANDSDALAAKHRVETARKLVITIPDEKANRFRALRERPSDLTRLLRHPRTVWMGRAASQVPAPTAEFDEKEHIEPLKPDRLHRKEVDGDQASGLRSDELAPRRAQTRAGSRRRKTASSCRRTTISNCAAWRSFNGHASDTASVASASGRQTLDLPGASRPAAESTVKFASWCFDWGRRVRKRRYSTRSVSGSTRHESGQGLAH